MSAADAILAALPDMIKPLVFSKAADGRGFIARSVTGQFAIFDEGNPRWSYSQRGCYTYTHVSTIEEAEAAANADHRAAIMEAFLT